MLKLRLVMRQHKIAGSPFPRTANDLNLAADEEAEPSVRQLSLGPVLP